MYAMTAGTFRTQLNIGAQVIAGQEVETINDSPLGAPLSGWLRGLAYDSAEIEPGSKVVEVNAGALPRSARALGERPLPIAKGVRAALHAMAAGERDDLVRHRAPENKPGADDQ